MQRRRVVELDDEPWHRPESTGPCRRPSISSRSSRRACSLVVDVPDGAHRAQHVLGVDVGAQRAGRRRPRRAASRSRRRSARACRRTRPSPPATDGLQRAASCPSWPPRSRRSGPSTRPARRRAGGRQQLRGRLAEVRDLVAVGGLDQRVAGREVAVERADPDARRAWRRRPARRPCPPRRTARSPRSSSFSRLRRASARLGSRCGHDVNGGCLRLRATLIRTGVSLRFILGGTADVESLVHHRHFEGLRPHLGRGRAGARRPGRRDRAQRRHADAARRDATATTSCRSRSTSPTRPRSTPPSRRRTSTSAASTSSSTTPATACSGRSRRSPRSRRASRSRRTCSARCGSPRRRCRSCASRARATSSRCRRSAASTRSRRSGSTTRRSGAWRRFSQSLAAEVAEFGIKVTIVEPAGYSTDWRGPSSVQADQMPDATTASATRRAQLVHRRAARARRPAGHRPRDPRARRRRRAAAAHRSSAPARST